MVAVSMGDRRERTAVTPHMVFSGREGRARSADGRSDAQYEATEAVGKGARRGSGVAD
jgi:hypothetical protein